MSKKWKAKKGKAPMAPVARYPQLAPYRWKTPKEVMEINGVKVYGASVYDTSEIPDLSLVIDLSGITVPERHLVTGNATARAELPPSLFARKVPIIYIEWADGSAHSLTVDWWETVISVIDLLPEGSSVAVCCVGGTGRTGTALAVLAGLTDQLGPDDLDPVAWVRERYYDDAVETDVQLHYVELITGFPIASDPSDFLGAPMTYQLGKPGTGAQGPLLPTAAGSGPIGAPASVGASDHTGA